MGAEEKPVGDLTLDEFWGAGPGSDGDYRSSMPQRPAVQCGHRASNPETYLMTENSFGGPQPDARPNITMPDLLTCRRRSEKRNAFLVAS